MARPAPRMAVLAVNAHAPLATWHNYAGARLKLYCGACGWAKTYDPEAIARRLIVLKRGGPMTPISAVARSVQWPCPGCRRMAWATVMMAPEEAVRGARPRNGESYPGGFGTGRGGGPR